VGVRRSAVSPGVEQQMDRKTTSQSDCSFAFSGPGTGAAPILVLALSLGLWVLIWAAVSLLGEYALR
jgi:hypothetical protein